MIFSCTAKEYQTPLKIEFSATKGMEIITQNGNALRIPPNSFEDEEGNDYNGKVNFELIEVYSKEEMITHDLTTTSGGKMLVSGGMFYLSAQTVEGENLILKKASSIGLCAKLLPSQNRYKRFYGSQNEQGFTWIPETKSQSSNFPDNGEFYHSDDCLDAFTFNINKLGWINYDYFENKSLEGGLAVKTDEENLKIRLVFKDINSIMGFQKNGNNYKLEKLPLNRKAKIIAYKQQNSKIRFYEQEVTIDSMQIFEIALEELTAEDFKEKMKNL